MKIYKKILVCFLSLFMIINCYNYIQIDVKANSVGLNACVTDVNSVACKMQVVNMVLIKMGLAAATTQQNFKKLVNTIISQISNFSITIDTNNYITIPKDTLKDITTVLNNSVYLESYDLNFNSTSAFINDIPDLSKSYNWLDESPYNPNLQTTFYYDSRTGLAYNYYNATIIYNLSSNNNIKKIKKVKNYIVPYGTMWSANQPDSFYTNNPFFGKFGTKDYDSVVSTIAGISITSQNMKQLNKIDTFIPSYNWKNLENFNIEKELSFVTFTKTEFIQNFGNAAKDVNNKIIVGDTVKLLCYTFKLFDNDNKLIAFNSENLNQLYYTVIGENYGRSTCLVSSNWTCYNNDPIVHSSGNLAYLPVNFLMMNGAYGYITDKNYREFLIDVDVIKQSGLIDNSKVISPNIDIIPNTVVLAPTTTIIDDTNISSVSLPLFPDRSIPQSTAAPTAIPGVVPLPYPTTTPNNDDVLGGIWFPDIPFPLPQIDLSGLLNLLNLGSFLGQLFSNLAEYIKKLFGSLFGSIGNLLALIYKWLTDFFVELKKLIIYDNFSLSLEFLPLKELIDKKLMFITQLLDIITKILKKFTYLKENTNFCFTIPTITFLGYTIFNNINYCIDTSFLGEYYTFYINLMTLVVYFGMINFIYRRSLMLLGGDSNDS